MKTLYHPISLRVIGCGSMKLCPKERAISDHSDEMNWRPRSEVICNGTPKRATHPVINARSQLAAVMS